MEFISITHLRLGGTHSSSSKQTFVSRCCRRTSRRQLRARDLGTADVANVDNYISNTYTIKQIQTVGPKYLSMGLLPFPPAKKKKTNTLQRLMGWFASWNQITSNSHLECVLAQSALQFGDLSSVGGSIPSKHSNGNLPDNHRLDDVPCTKNFEHFALPAMLRQSSWDSEVGLPKTNAGARNKNKAVGISLVIVNKHENGTTCSRMCVYFKQARTNLEVDAPLICSITIFCWWKRVLYWKKRRPALLLVKYHRPSISQVSTVFCRPAKAAGISLPFGFPADCFHLCIPTSGAKSIAQGPPFGFPTELSKSSTSHRLLIPHFSKVRCLWRLLDIRCSCLKLLVYGIYQHYNLIHHPKYGKKKQLTPMLEHIPQLERLGWVNQILFLVISPSTIGI